MDPLRVLGPLTALACVLGTAAAAANPPVLTLPFVPDSGIAVDGRLDEDVWERALRIDEFWNFYPVDQGRAEVETVARIFYDRERLYFAFDCPSEEGGRVRAHLSAREDINRDDQVGVYLDTFDDDRRGFVFYVNAVGVQQDIRWGEDTGLSFEWDARYLSAGKITPQGYTVEMAIPFESLRFPRGDEQRFGLVLTRKLAADDRKVVFPRVERGPGLWAQAATLVGMRDVSPGRPLEIIPSATFSATWERDDEGAMTPQHPVDLRNLHRGATLRWGVTPNLSLGAAVHPDFSQVESDPDQLDVNTRYALSLDEKRPFFLEGIDVFDLPLDTMYTRSIVAPIEGVNFNGTERGWTVGLLHALDESPAASVVAEAETPGFGEDGVEGRKALNNVVRVRRDVGKRGSIGIFAADKELGSDLASAPEASNRVGGIDAYIPLGGPFHVQGQALYSFTGERGGESMHGLAYSLEAGLEDSHGEAWIEHQLVSPGFRAETGFINRVDQIKLQVGGEYRFDVARGALRDVQPWGEAEVLFDHGGTVTDEWAMGAVRWRLGSLNFLTFGGWQGHLLYADERFTGGGGWLKFFTGSIDAFRWMVKLHVGNELNYDPDDLFQGTCYDIDAYLMVRIARRLTVEVDGLHHVMYRTWGDRQYDVQLLRTTVLLSFTRALWLRAVAQVDTYDSDLGFELLVAYTPFPGTAVYLGYSEGAGWGAGPFAVQQRTLFVKAQVLFMP